MMSSSDYVLFMMTIAPVSRYSNEKILSGFGNVTLGVVRAIKSVTWKPSMTSAGAAPSACSWNWPALARARSKRVEGGFVYDLARLCRCNGQCRLRAVGCGEAHRLRSFCVASLKENDRHSPR